MNRAAGYTLLEMVVVLAVLGLATALVAPSTFRMIQSWRDADEVQQVLAEVAALPVAARQIGSEIRLGTGQASASGIAPIRPPGAEPGNESGIGTAPATAPPIDLPEGWRLDMDTPLLVRPNGACNAGKGTLTTNRQSIRFEVEAPFCRVRRLPADAP